MKKIQEHVEKIEPTKEVKETELTWADSMQQYLGDNEGKFQGWVMKGILI